MIYIDHSRPILSGKSSVKSYIEKGLFDPMFRGNVLRFLLEMACHWVPSFDTRNQNNVSYLMNLMCGDYCSWFTQVINVVDRFFFHEDLVSLSRNHLISPD